MGLDQYFYYRNPGTEIEYDEYGYPDSHGIEVAYFRKHNPLHGWVEQKVLDGRQTNSEEITIDIEQLAHLKHLCEQVLANPYRGPELLPSYQGFFFGSYEYDDWYLEKIQGIRDAIERVLVLITRGGVIEVEDYKNYNKETRKYEIEEREVIPGGTLYYVSSW